MRIAAIVATAGMLLTACTGGEPAVTSPVPQMLSPVPLGSVPALCSTADWETGAIDATGVSTDPLAGVRAGRHDCYDRIVFDIGGASLVGFSVRYVPQVAAVDSGAPVPVPGGAVLQVVVRAPAQDVSGKALAATGGDLIDPAHVANWDALRAARFAGSSADASTIAVGVRERLPFRVLSLLDPDRGTRRVVVDIAHRGSQ
ncbi:hypothetical protein HFP15_04090 [Amycolatopsis sp. K13G38]|uniref:AMIN-like domain-containing protein n=1 Tax=Amycolatopsis acididurans TaxID=2724524 RepID=A0ABX1IX37_9PSEU|nr:hypothetical protein [Amycolatopsis acididurans]NKQ52056.1 hypothetical protein [Amycolatopsis acididurans]